MQKYKKESFSQYAHSKLAMDVYTENMRGKSDRSAEKPQLFRTSAYNNGEYLDSPRKWRPLRIIVIFFRRRESFPGAVRARTRTTRTEKNALILVCVFSRRTLDI